MRILELLCDLDPGALTEMFGKQVTESVESRLSVKSNKDYVRCLVRDKDVQAKREELVRQLWLHRLVQHYKYPVSRLAVEFAITFGRDTSKRAGIVVMDSDRPAVPYLMVEVKQGKFKDGKEQLRSYAHATGAPLALWCNGVESVAWHRKNPNYFVEIPDIPSVSQTIDDIAGQPWTVQSLIEIERKREAEGKSARTDGRNPCAKRQEMFNSICSFPRSTGFLCHVLARRSSRKLRRKSHLPTRCASPPLIRLLAQNNSYSWRLAWPTGSRRSR